MNRIFTRLFLAFAMTMALAWPSPTVQAAPINIIFDSDMGDDVDDVMALDILIKYHDMGHIKLLGIMSNRDAPSSPVYCDIYTTFCGHPELPIGICVNGSNPRPEPRSFAFRTMNIVDNGRPAYRLSRRDHRALPNAVDLYRRLLAKAKDHSVVIVSTGFSTNLARLMETTADEASPLTGLELLKRKVSWISVMAGNFQKPEPEFNVYNDVAAAKKLFENPPVPMAFCDFELGKRIRYPATSVEQDFNWVKRHPFTDAYRFYKKMPHDRPTWDPISALYALEPRAGYFGLTERGRITVDERGTTTFTPDPQGLCRVLTATDEQCRKVLHFFTTLIPKRPKLCTAR